MKNKWLLGVAISGITLLSFSGNALANSININPTNELEGEQTGFKVYVNYSGSSSDLTTATKKYKVTNDATVPTDYPNDLSSSNEIKILETGTKYIHIQYTLSNGEKLYASGGPYKITAEANILQKVEMVRNTNGKYSVTAEVNDKKAKMASVTVDGKKMIASVGSSIYKITGLTAKPNSIKAIDENGKEETKTFLAIPSVDMGEYKIDEKFQKAPIQATINAGVNQEITYRLNDDIQSCGTSSCEINLNENGTFTVYATDGKLTTGYSYSITNLDDANPELVMNGKRNATQPTTINYTWNYPVKNGTLKCENNGEQKQYGGTIEGTAFNLENAQNSIECQLSGTYYGEEIVSNKVFIEGLKGADFSDVTKYKKIKYAKAIEEESRVGTTYFINSSISNQKETEVPIPLAPFE